MNSSSLAGFCIATSYIASFNIFNIPGFAELIASDGLSAVLGGRDSDISVYASDPASILHTNFTYAVINNLPLTKPLVVECPIPACVFPISGYFAFLQRILFYANMIVAAVALHFPVLRGIAQIWLTTFWCSAGMLLLITFSTTASPLIYNLDLPPALVVVHTGFLPTLLWFALRAEPSSPMSSTKNQFWSRYCLYPVARILVPLYVLVDITLSIIASVVQDSPTHGVWPKSIAVVLESETEYLLTSPCFQDSLGSVGLWTPLPGPYNGVRKLSDMTIYYPPPGTITADALQVILTDNLLIVHVLSILLGLVIILLSFVPLTWLQNWLRYIRT
jgi:hypothetical protein